MKTILVVDDSKTARLTLKRKLDLLPNVQVDMADSGEAAIELLKHSAPPDLIFMDVLMGNMSGYEAAATILNNPAMADVPIVMCTSKDAQEDRDEAAKNGAKGFIIKPITDQALNDVWRDLVLNRVQAAPVATATPPVPAPVAIEVQAAMPEQIVISAELETLVRQMVEQSNLQRAEEAAAQVVHAALAEHLLLLEDMLEGKISILTSSLAALHSAQEQAQAEYKNALATMPQTGSAVDEGHITSLITHQLMDFAAQEHSKRALHELDFQTKLEQSLPQLADQAAHSAAERIIKQALDSHFALIDDKLDMMNRELAALKSAPKTEAPAALLDEHALLAQLGTQIEAQIEAQLERRMKDSVQSLLNAHMQASDEKLHSLQHELGAGIQGIQRVADALAAQTSKDAPSVMPQELPAEWMQQMLSQQNEMLEQRFNAWSANMDAQITKNEHSMFDRIDDQMNALSLRTAATQAAAEPSMLSQQQGDASNSKLALGVAALAVVLALVALFT